jgi:galactose-1-phosphate uridylyltransferase
MEKDFAAEGAPKFLPDKTAREVRLSAKIEVSRRNCGMFDRATRNSGRLYSEQDKCYAFLPYRHPTWMTFRVVPSATA